MARGHNKLHLEGTEAIQDLTALTNWLVDCLVTGKYESTRRKLEEGNLLHMSGLTDAPKVKKLNIWLEASVSMLHCNNNF
jgi:hypothetical protein